MYKSMKEMFKCFQFDDNKCEKYLKLKHNTKLEAVTDIKS